MSVKPIATTRSATGIPTGRLAVWWLLASEVVIFGGLLGSYIMHRMGHPEWAEAAVHTNTWFGGIIGPCLEICMRRQDVICHRGGLIPIVFVPRSAQPFV